MSRRSQIKPSRNRRAPLLPQPGLGILRSWPPTSTGHGVLAVYSSVALRSRYLSWCKKILITPPSTPPPPQKTTQNKKILRSKFELKTGKWSLPRYKETRRVSCLAFSLDIKVSLINKLDQYTDLKYIIKLETLSPTFYPDLVWRWWNRGSSMNTYIHFVTLIDCQTQT